MRKLILIVTCLLIPTLVFAAYKPVIDEDLDYYEAGAPTTADYLVGTANGSLSAEIVVGTTPGGELGGTWASPTVDATHSGSAHHSPITLDTNADDILSLTTQAVGLQTQTANTVFAGRVDVGTALVPTFRGLVAADIPALSYQPTDADLTTYAGITPSANAQTLLGQTFAQMQGSLSIDHLITLSGVAEGSVNLATFTGTTIADNVTNKAALQALETAVEGKEAADANIIKSGEIDTLAELDAIVADANILSEEEIDASSELAALMDDETGTAGNLVFSNSPTFDDDIQLGKAGATGILKLYSEQGATDFTASLYPNTAMTSAASFYLPVDEPAAQGFMSMSTGGVMSTIAPNAGTNIANDLEEEVTEGSLADSTIVSADIKANTIVAADIAADTITHTEILDSDQADTKCFYFENPVATDDFKSIWANKTANDFLITEIWGESDQTVSFDLQVDDGSPADVNGTDIAPAAGEAEDTALNGDTTVAAGEELDLAVTSVTNTPTWCSICFTGNWVDG